jgi:uncharacterized protein YcfL
MKTEDFILNKQYQQILIIIIAIFFISACKNVPPVTSGIGSSQIDASQKYSEHLQLDNKKLAEKVYISDIKSRQQNDLLQVNLSLTSRYKKSLSLQYQLQWFDKDGYIIEAGKSPWQAVALHGMQTTTVNGLAPTTNVEKFSLYVREVPEKFFKF